MLREYADVIAWSPKDMPGLDESVAMEKPSVDPKKAPKDQSDAISHQTARKQSTLR